MSSVTISHPAAVTTVPTRSWPAALLIGWHLLSLDAPSVAVVWLLLLNRQAGRPERFVEAAALGLAVWCIYALDRLLDVSRLHGELRGSHSFHHRHCGVFFAGLAFALPAMLVLVGLLPHGVRIAWLVLALPLALYGASVHLLRIAEVPKEKCVGIFFAIAVALPVWKGSSSVGLLIEAGLFGLLCWLNCLAIALWEGPASATGAKRIRSFLLLFVASSLVFTVFSGSMAVGLPLALSGALLLLLHVFRQKFAPLLLRSMADAALLTPLLVLPFLHQPW